MKRIIKSLSEIPAAAAQLLFERRFPEDRDMGIDECIKQYGFIVVDGTGYAAEDDYSQWMAKTWANLEDMSVELAHIPCAIIERGEVLKNRYGKF